MIYRSHVIKIFCKQVKKVHQYDPIKMRQTAFVQGEKNLLQNDDITLKNLISRD